MRLRVPEVSLGLGPFATLMLIGIVRNWLEVALGIVVGPGWYSHRTDIVFAMAFFPPYLCYAMGFLCWGILRLFARPVQVEALLPYFFWIQLIHLLIPFLDVLGARHASAWSFEPGLNPGLAPFDPNPFFLATRWWHYLVVLTPAILYFTKPPAMTFGILCAWHGVGVTLFWFLRRRFALPAWQILCLFLLQFPLLYWPIYRHWVYMEAVLSWILERFSIVLPGFHVFGYGSFFMLGATAAFLALRRLASQSRIAAPSGGHVWAWGSLLLALWTGRLWYQNVVDWMAFPGRPTPISVREAAEHAEGWVRLVDLRFPCALDSVKLPTGVYVFSLGTGGYGSERIVVPQYPVPPQQPRPCTDAGQPESGRLEHRRPGWIAGLSFPATPWSTWPTEKQTTLWIDWPPVNARIGAWGLPGLWLFALWAARRSLRSAG